MISFHRAFRQGCNFATFSLRRRLRASVGRGLRDRLPHDFNPPPLQAANVITIERGDVRRPWAPHGKLLVADACKPQSLCSSNRRAFITSCYHIQQHLHSSTATLKAEHAPASPYLHHECCQCLVSSLGRDATEGEGPVWSDVKPVQSSNTARHLFHSLAIPTTSP